MVDGVILIAIALKKQEIIAIPRDNNNIPFRHIDIRMQNRHTPP